MKLSALIKTLVLMAGILLFDTHVCEAKLVKPSGGSVSANVVISKVFYSGSKTIADSPKAYANNIYIELYNNSTDTLDLKGMYIALGNTDNGDAAWTASAMATAHKDSAVVKQLFQISPDASYPMKPGQSVVLAQCAINHSQLAGGNVDKVVDALIEKLPESIQEKVDSQLEDIEQEAKEKIEKRSYLRKVKTALE